MTSAGSSVQQDWYKSVWLPLTPGLCPQVLFALCSLLRHFPYAQQQFLKLGGLQVLRSLVQEESAKVLAVRVVTLLYDLVTEKVSAHTCSVFPFVLSGVRFWPFVQSAPSNASVQLTGRTHGWMEGGDMYQRGCPMRHDTGWNLRAGEEGRRC